MQKKNSRASGGFPFSFFFFFPRTVPQTLFRQSISLSTLCRSEPSLIYKKLRFSFFFSFEFSSGPVSRLSPPVNLFSSLPSVSFLLFLFPPNSFVRQQIERKHSEAARVYLPPLQRIHHEKSKYIFGTRTHTLRTHVSLSVCSTCIFYYTDCPRDSYSIPIVPTSLRNKISI